MTFTILILRANLVFYTEIFRPVWEISTRHVTMWWRVHLSNRGCWVDTRKSMVAHRIYSLLITLQVPLLILFQVKPENIWLVQILLFRPIRTVNAYWSSRSHLGHIASDALKSALTKHLTPVKCEKNVKTKIQFCKLKMNQNRLRQELHSEVQWEV